MSIDTVAPLLHWSVTWPAVPTGEARKAAIVPNATSVDATCMLQVDWTLAVTFTVVEVVAAWAAPAAASAATERNASERANDGMDFMWSSKKLIREPPSSRAQWWGSPPLLSGAHPLRKLRAMVRHITISTIWL